MVSIFLRSLVYNVLFYALLVFWILVALPTFLMPRAGLHGGRQGLGAQQRLADARGLQHQSGVSRAARKFREGPLIVASKHQSMWETFALMQFFDAPLFIYKRELTWIPFFGWYLMKSEMIGVDRTPAAALADGHGARAPARSSQRPAADHLSRGHPHARSMRRRITRPASPRSMSIAACRACRSR